MILVDGMDGLIVRKVIGDRFPGLALVGALQNIRLEVVPLAVVERGEHHVGIKVRREDIADVGMLGHTGEIFHFHPVLSGIFGHLDESVVGAYVEQAFLQR